MRTLIIDDEKQIRDGFKILLSNFHAIEVVGEAATADQGVFMIEKKQPDLVFLDIQLKNDTGFTILEKLNTINFKLVFVTAHDQYAIKSFKYSAFDYLLKPIDPEEFGKTIQRLETQTTITNTQIDNLKSVSANQKLIIKTLEQTYVLSIKDIVRCEASLNYTFFYLKDGKRILSSKTLKEYDLFLPSSIFIRVHQSHLVNLNYIKAFANNGKLQLSNSEDEIPVSIRKRKEFKILLSNL